MSTISIGILVRCCADYLFCSSSWVRCPRCPAVLLAVGSAEFGECGYRLGGHGSAPVPISQAFPGGAFALHPGQQDLRGGQPVWKARERSGDGGHLGDDLSLSPGPGTAAIGSAVVGPARHPNDDLRPLS